MYNTVSFNPLASKTSYGLPISVISFQFVTKKGSNWISDFLNIISLGRERKIFFLQTLRFCHNFKNISSHSHVNQVKEMRQKDDRKLERYIKYYETLLMDFSAF